jgi:hypothetical protein
VGGLGVQLSGRALAQHVRPSTENKKKEKKGNELININSHFFHLFFSPGTFPLKKSSFNVLSPSFSDQCWPHVPQAEVSLQAYRNLRIWSVLGT